MEGKLFQALGQQSCYFLPPGVARIRRTDTADLEVTYWAGSEWRAFVSGEELEAARIVRGQFVVKAGAAGHRAAAFELLAADGEAQGELRLDCYTFYLSLDTDTDRDGWVEPGNPEKARWIWGPDQPGAILLVNCIENRQDYLVNPAARAIRQRLMTPLRVQPAGVADAPSEAALVLYATPAAAQRFCIYRRGVDGALERVLGRDLIHPNFPAITMSEPLDTNGEDLFVEALEYPSESFEGLITVELYLRLSTTEVRDEPGVLLTAVEGAVPPIYRADTVSVRKTVDRAEVLAVDRVVFRVAPWIMTPNTQPAREVFVCLFPADPRGGRIQPSALVNKLESLCGKHGVHVRVLDPEESGGSPFIQDVVEFGYSQGAGETIDVVCASTVSGMLRNLDLLGPQMGQVRMSGAPGSTLDSFGNLEVSPPVTVRGHYYPLGRILFGGHAYGDFEPAREMMPTLRRFLYAQKVQSPIELYTDWLRVGHVDEILSFVPSKESRKGFRLLLASPDAACGILRRLQSEGGGSQPMFRGRREREQFGAPALTVNELLAADEFWDDNARFQRNMDINRRILKQELELDEGDIVDIPLLFVGQGLRGGRAAAPSDGRTSALYPNLINHLVLGETSIMPRPHGPLQDDRCVFETYIRQHLPEREILFVDDWFSYFVLSGDVHCATNVRRTPFSSVRWWEFKPDAGFDV